MALTLATTAAACGGGDDDGGSSADGVTTISVATFNEFGYEDLIDEWNAANDDIKIEQVKVGTWDDAKANFYTKLAAGSGLSDIEAIEGDGMPAIMRRERRLHRPHRPRARRPLARLEGRGRPPTPTAS